MTEDDNREKQIRVSARPGSSEEFLLGQLDRLRIQLAPRSAMERAGALLDRIPNEHPHAWLSAGSYEIYETAIASAITAAETAARAEEREACAQECDQYGRDGRLHKEYACEMADELAARIRSRSTQP